MKVPKRQKNQRTQKPFIVHVLPDMVNGTPCISAAKYVQSENTGYRINDVTDECIEAVKTYFMLTMKPGEPMNGRSWKDKEHHKEYKLVLCEFDLKEEATDEGN